MIKANSKPAAKSNVQILIINLVQHEAAKNSPKKKNLVQGNLFSEE